jgi:hypothetical protein
LPYDLNNCLFVNLDSIIFLASMMHVAWSNPHELHRIDENKSSKPFLHLKAKMNWGLGIRYLL